VADDVLVHVRGLAKTFRIGFFRKRVDAVRGIDFDVHRGEIHGLLGPNGAGKTTTIKMLLRLIHPSAGEIQLFGQRPHRALMSRIGYMPENPYIYNYLKPREFLDLCGRLVGLPARKRRAKADELITRVGLDHARGRPVGKFSKGMMQRVGLAQALLTEPELLILDEPMSGLDPIGRKDIRDLLVEQRAKGTTMIFTSHILSDVETLCDRVTILQRGKVEAEGGLRELLERDVDRVEVELEQASPELVSALDEVALDAHTALERRILSVRPDDVDAVLRRALEAGASVAAVRPMRKSLERLFVQRAESPSIEEDDASDEHVT